MSAGKMEMSSVNPLSVSEECDQNAFSLKIARLLNHQPFEISSTASTLGAVVSYHKPSGKSPRIVHYALNNKKYPLFWALFSYSHTILIKRESWVHFSVYFLLMLISCILITAFDAANSIQIFGVSSEIQTLLGFIISGYIVQALTRWDDMANSLIPSLVTNLEQLYLQSRFFFCEASSGSCAGRTRQQLLLRHCRLLLYLVFQAGQHRPDLPSLVDRGLVLGKELQWLEVAAVRSRPYLVLGWVHQSFLSLKEESGPDMSDIDSFQKGATDAMHKIFNKVDVQLPYVYTHIIYWVVYLLLISFVCEAGVDSAIHFDNRDNGNGEKDDDAGEWPEFGHVYINHWAIAMMVGKGIYIIFLEGLVQVCASVQNPLADRAIGLCVDHIDVKFQNAMTAMLAAQDPCCFKEILTEALQRDGQSR